MHANTQDIVNLGAQFPSAELPNSAIVQTHIKGEFSHSHYRKASSRPYDAGTHEFLAPRFDYSSKRIVDI